jgi:hypothetical protein
MKIDNFFAELKRRNVYPMLDDLRGDPRFDALVQKVVSPKQ